MTLTQHEALDCLVSAFPSLDRREEAREETHVMRLLSHGRGPLSENPKFAQRFEKAWTLFRHGAVQPVSHCSPWAWEVRCEHPERTRPGDPLKYVAVIAGGVADWRCECADSVFRRCVCKHILAAVLVATFGPFERETVRIVVTADAEYEDWLSAIADEAGQCPPDDGIDWTLAADWADEDLLPEMVITEVSGYQR